MENQNITESHQRIEAIKKLLNSLKQALEDLKVLTRFDEGQLVQAYVNLSFFHDLVFELESRIVEVKKMLVVAIAEGIRADKLAGKGCRR